MDDFPLLARPGQTLKAHIDEVATHAARCGAKIGMETAAQISALSHDLGKVSKDFQKYIRKVIPGRSSHGKKIDHSTLGGQFLSGHFTTDSSSLKKLRQAIILCGLSHHHGSLIDILSPAGDMILKERLNKAPDDTHYKELTPETLKEIQESILSLSQSEKLMNELEKFESIANNPSKTIKLFYWSLLSRFLFSCLVEADQVSAAGEFSEIQPIPDWEKLLTSLNDHLAQFDNQPADPVNSLRKELSDICLENASREQGQYLLNLPTGGGKTLASLRFALAHAKQHKLDRIIYVVPYTSIIEQNAKVAREALRDEAAHIVLEHHSNLTRDQDTEEYRNSIQSWNAPVVFTTSVQFLNSLFASGASNVRRMNALARCIIIFDEVQAIPLHSIHLFNNALNFLSEVANSTTVCCTATQPALDLADEKKGYSAQNARGSLNLSKENTHIVPNYRYYFKEFSRFRTLNIDIQYRQKPWSLESMSELALNEADAHGSVLFIVNTRTLARNLFAACKKGGYEVHHLSTFMCPIHRSEVIQNELQKHVLRQKKQDGKKVICITTQLIEAGVDVDFDVVIRSIAGLDSIAQAAGRCNRDGKSSSGTLILINPEGKLENLTSLHTLQEGKDCTERIIRNYNEDLAEKGSAPGILEEEWLSEYFEYFYKRTKIRFDYQLSVDHLSTNYLDLTSCNPEPYASAKHSWKDWNTWSKEFPLRQSFDSASRSYRVIDADTIEVLVPYGEGKEIISQLSELKYPQSDKEWNQVRQLLRQAQSYSVSLFTNQLAKLEKIGKFKQYFSTIEGSFTMHCLSPTCYDSKLGFIETNDNIEATIF